MKKALKVIVLGILFGQMAFAGGIVTNTNQSAQWVRMPSRDASTDVDAIYYNPAGVIGLGQGLHFSLSNESIFQEYTISNDLAGLRSSEYIGDVSAPIYPNVYASYNKEKWALSFGSGPVGGGGSASYDNGLPQFDMLLMNTIGTNPQLAPLSSFATNYDADIAFDGSSVYYGMQLGFAYKINEMISASIGGRLVIAKNQYNGHIKDVKGGTNEIAIPIALNVDAAQNATGFAPIIGLNFTPNEKLNISMKWEGKTALEFTNETVEDGTGMYPDDAKSHRDIPMMFNIGAQYKITDNFRAQVSYHQFFDKDANWDGKEDLVDDNFHEITFGAEFDITEMFTISAGCQIGKTGVSEAYQDNTSFSLSSNTFGFGGAINISEQLSIDLGFATLIYDDMDDNTAAPLYTTNYDKNGIMLAIGVNYSIF